MPDSAVIAVRFGDEAVVVVFAPLAVVEWDRIPRASQTELGVTIGILCQNMRPNGVQAPWPPSRLGQNVLVCPGDSYQALLYEMNPKELAAARPTAPVLSFATVAIGLDRLQRLDERPSRGYMIIRIEPKKVY